MTRYVFHLRNDQGVVRDEEGVELPHDDAAIAHARRVAVELLRNREVKTRHWRIEVETAEGRRVHDTNFFDEDRSLDHLKPAFRATLRDVGERWRALQETNAAARRTIRQARALVARSRGKPYAVDDAE
jgi:hypothetical protein